MCRVLAIVIIAAVFPAIIFAEDSMNSTSKNVSCTSSSQPLKAMRIELSKCWDDVINIVANETYKPKFCKNVTDFEEKTSLFFKQGEKACPDNDWERRSTKFTEMLNETIINKATFKDFFSKKCVNLKNYTDTCHKNAKSSVASTELSWYYKFNLKYTSLTCDIEEKIKNCALKLLQENCPNTVGYVTLMFDVALKNCTDFQVQTQSAAQAQNTPTSSAKIATASSAPFMLLSMPLILVQYLLTYQ